MKLNIIEKVRIKKKDEMVNISNILKYNALKSFCEEKGLRAKIDAKWLYEREPVGPILPPNGEIVVEDGIEYVKPISKERTLSL